MEISEKSLIKYYKVRKYALASRLKRLEKEADDPSSDKDKLRKETLIEKGRMAELVRFASTFLSHKFPNIKKIEDDIDYEE